MKHLFKCMVCAALLAVSVSVCHAEISTNLHVQKEYDSNKKVTQLTYVDDSGAVCAADDLGYAIARYQYRNKRLVRTTFYNAADERVNCAEGWAECAVSYNSRGSVIEKIYYDVQGKPVIGPEGYARQTNEYNYKTLIETINYGADNKLMRSDTLFAKMTTKFIIDENVRRLLEQSWQDADGNLMAGPEGYATIKYTYKNNHYLESQAFYGADGQLFYSEKDGFACMRREYANGKCVKESYYNEQDQLAPGPNGYAYAVNTYQAGTIDPVLIQYFSADDTPYLLEDGYAAVQRTYGSME